MAQTNPAENTPEPSPWTFGLADRLEKALKVGRVSNGSMAAALDVSRNTVTNYTSGRTTPSKLQVKEWAIRTGAPFEWLWDGVDTKKAPTPKGEGRKLPGLDSNQEPIGLQPQHDRAVVSLGDFAASRTSSAAARAAHPAGTGALVSAIR